MTGFLDSNKGHEIDGLTYADYGLQYCWVYSIDMSMPQDLTSPLSATVCSQTGFRLIQMYTCGTNLGLVLGI